MPDFDWRDFLDIAESLVEGQNTTRNDHRPDTPSPDEATEQHDPLRDSAARSTASEAAARTAISRAYYAAFNVARLYVRERYPLETLPRHGAVHVKVPELLKMSRGARREERAAAAYLDRLKAQRTQADYNARARSSLHDARRCIENARRTILMLEKLAEKL